MVNRSIGIIAAISLLACSTIRAQVAQPATSTTFVFPARDSVLQRQLESAMSVAPYRDLIRNRQMSVVLVDLTDSSTLRWAGLDVDRMRYAASLAKIGIMLGVFDQVDKRQIRYTPQLREQLTRMIRRSENRVSSDLIRMVGFEAIEQTLRDPRYQFYSRSRNGGLWVGRGYGGLGTWRRDPINRISHGATARQVARFLVMLEREQLISPWASAEMKDIMGSPEIHHKFVRGLDARPGSVIYRKSGTFRNWHSDAAIVERDGIRYIAVAMAESSRAPQVFPRLIVTLDDLVVAGHTPTTAVQSQTEDSPSAE